MAFPSLYPDGTGDPTNLATKCNVTLGEKVKHLIRFRECINDKWEYRFASHPRFAYWAFNTLKRHRLLSQGSIYLKQNPVDSHLSVQQLKPMLAWISLTFHHQFRGTFTKSKTTKCYTESTHFRLAVHWQNWSLCQVLVKRSIRIFLALVWVWICCPMRFNSLSWSCKTQNVPTLCQLTRLLWEAFWLLNTNSVS